MAKRKPAAKPRETARPRYRATLIVFALALVLRLIAAFQINALPLSREAQFDSFEYQAWAEHIAAGDFSWPAPPPHGPGYPFFMALLLATTGGSLLAVRIAQSLLGALTCLLVARAGTRWFGERAGVAAGALLAIYAPLIWIDVSILAEGLLMALLAAALWAMATEKHPVIIGLLLGFAAIVRPTALLVVPLFVFAAAKTWRLRAALLVALCVPIAPVTIANWRALHAFIPIQAFGGMNSYLGNSPLRDGLPSARPGGDWDRVASDAVHHGAKTTAEEERYFARKTRAEIAQHPFAFAKLLAKKLVWTFQAEEVRDTHSFYFFAGRVAMLRWLPGFTLLFALAAAGAFAADWRNAATRYAAIFLALTACATVLLVAASRYRLPIVLALALFGGIGIVRLWEWRRDAKRLALAGVIILVAGACTRVWTHPPSHDFAEEQALTAKSLIKLEDNDAAESAARQAIETDARNPLAWDALGLVLDHKGQTIAAREALQRATTLNPDFSAAWLHFGNVFSELHDDAGAERAYAAAVELSPHDARPVAHLAPLLAKRGDLPAAQRVYARLVELSPGDWRAMMTLARIDGVLAKPAEGLEVAERAVALHEPEADDWMVMALLAAQAGKTDTATSALQRAGSAASGPQGMFIAALVRYRQNRLDEAQQIVDQLLARAPDFADAQWLREEIAQKKAAGETPRRP